MKLTLAEPKYFKDSIAIISELVNEGTFKINKDAIELVAMDPANVAMVVFKLLSSCFSEYQVESETELAINLGNLKQILRRVKPNDILSLELADSRLKITLKSDTVRTFSLPIINIEEKEQKVPELSFPVSIKTTTDILNEVIEDVGIVAESVTLNADPSKLVVSAEGDLSKADIVIKPDDQTRIDCQSDEVIRAKYSVEYLKKMVAGGKLADEVSISFNKDYPLKIEFKEVDKVMLDFILAPRVENE
ncbi:proliferating cell nuclear antigen (pcna) [Nanoarchaeota archaeon]